MNEMKPTETGQEAPQRVIVADFDLNQIRVKVVDIDMPMGSMVSFFIKCAVAAIPAMIILGFIAAFLMAFLSAIGNR